MTEPSTEKNGHRVRTRLSRIQFPEVCPVCSDKAEDLVFVTVMEQLHPASYESTSMIRGEDKASVALETARGATTFPVPTCLRHGSKSVRSVRTKIVAAAGFFIFFYPILFFLLQINTALIYSRSVTEPVVGLLMFITALVATSVYGLFPRALERALKFENIGRGKDTVEVIMTNNDYRARFVELNEMFIESARNEKEARVGSAN